jgi:Family of unknown function (DUF6049)
MRWARISLCALVTSVTLLAGTISAAAAVDQAGAGAPTTTTRPLLALTSQTPWVSPAAPWFSLAVAVGSHAGPAGDLRVEVSFYNRINDASEMGQSMGGTPTMRIITHFPAAVSASPGGGVATTCATVLPDSSASAPTTVPPNSVACPAGSPTVTLGCTPGNASCGDVYPVSVALYRQGTTAPLSHFTTFLTYQEPGLPGSPGPGGPLRVGLIVPISLHFSPALSRPPATALRVEEALTGVLASHRGVAFTVAANPATVTSMVADGKTGHRTREQLESFAGAPGDDQVISQPFVPIDVAALAGAGLTGEIGAQLVRGASLLRGAGLRPTAGTWVDTASDFSAADATQLGDGLAAAGADRVVLDDTDLQAAGSGTLTYAQTFSLGVGHGSHVTAAAANSQVDDLFTADPGNPVLAANQILASLEFIHFENPFEPDARGIVVEPPASWQPSTTLITTLLDEMVGNPALSAVTMNQFFSKVAPGGNKEPVSRHLKAGSPPKSAVISAASAERLSTARVRLTSFSAAVDGHPAVLTELSDLMLATENKAFDASERAAALSIFTERFGDELNLISLANQGTITFTSRTAAIPVSVVSAAPFTVKVVVSLTSDKFSFPDGTERTLVLDRPTTPVRIEARSRTSGDRLPVGVTLLTPDGQLVIARAALTVHATSISLVGVALTALAALVLLVWWARTWRKGRRQRVRAA